MNSDGSVTSLLVFCMLPGFPSKISNVLIELGNESLSSHWIRNGKHYYRPTYSKSTNDQISRSSTQTSVQIHQKVFCTERMRGCKNQEIETIRLQSIELRKTGFR